MKKILLTLGTVGAGTLLAMRGRTGHPGLEKLRGWNYAHRGLHGEGIPENSLAAFRAAVEHGYGAELDIHLLKDGGLAVIHDSLLQRTTGREGKVEDLTEAELKAYPLEGTEETIPAFHEVLEVFAGKTPLIIELKAEGDNYAALCEAACKAMDGYEGVWCMESFDPRVVLWLKKNRPDIIRGQLAENYLRKRNEKLPLLLKTALAWNLENFICQPDFMAYDFTTRKTLGNAVCRKLWGMESVSWTLRTPEEHETALKEGWIPIFEHYKP
jgi:glycerophosphoryl diester phosphodiesterase